MSVLGDRLRKRLEAYRVPKEKADRLNSTLPPGVMQMVRDQATSQIARKLLERYDAREISADDFVELIRSWLSGK